MFFNDLKIFSMTTSIALEPIFPIPYLYTYLKKKYVENYHMGIYKTIVLEDDDDVLDMIRIHPTHLTYREKEILLENLRIFNSIDVSETQESVLIAFNVIDYDISIWERMLWSLKELYLYDLANKAGVVLANGEIKDLIKCLCSMISTETLILDSDESMVFMENPKFDWRFIWPYVYLFAPIFDHSIYIKKIKYPVPRMVSHSFSSPTLGLPQPIPMKPVRQKTYPLLNEDLI